MNDSKNANNQSPMRLGDRNVFEVTHNGQTKTVSGANSRDDAARQAFGSNGNYARVEQTQTRKWT